LGFRSRIQPSALPAGIAAYMENMRCNRGTARVRKGTKALATDINLSEPAVILDFDLPTDYPVTITESAGTATATFTVGRANTWQVGDVISIDGADQPEYNGDVTLTAVNTSGPDIVSIEYAVSGSPTSPATGTILASMGPYVIDTDNDGVRCACVFTSPGYVEGILFATTDRAFLYRYDTATAQIAYPTGEQVEQSDNCHLEQYLDSVYLFRGYQTAVPLAVTSITRSSLLCTVTTTTAHNLATGDWVYTSGGGTGELEYNGLFQITVADTDEFTYSINAGTPTSPATAADFSVRPCKAPLVWDGDTANDFVAVPSGDHADVVTDPTLRRMPPADWCAEFTRRLIVPSGRDQLLASDFSDADTWDLQYAQLRIRPGGNDWVVGGLPFQDRGYLVLYRKSVHFIYFATTTAAPSGVQEVTRAFGCVARRTAVNTGDYVLWLSDLGVLGCRTDQNLNLIPLARPLSDPVQDLIDTINWTTAENAVAKYWNNRLYLAVPVGTSTINNQVLVFNFLNRTQDSPLGEWESVDTFQGDFDVKDFLILDYAGQKRLHVITSYGFVFLYEQLDSDEWGNTSGEIGTYPVPGRIHLRDFQLGSILRKKFNRARLRTQLEVGDTFSVDFLVRNPDAETSLLVYSADTETDVDHVLRVPRLRGESGTMQIVTSAGRPEFRTFGIEGTVVNDGNNTRK